MARSFFDTFVRSGLTAPDAPSTVKRLARAAKSAKRYRMSGAAVTLASLYDRMEGQHFGYAVAGLDPRSLLAGDGSTAWIDQDLPRWQIDYFRNRGVTPPTGNAALLRQEGGKVYARGVLLVQGDIEMTPEFRLGAGGAISQADPFGEGNPACMRVIYALLAMMRAEAAVMLTKGRDGVTEVALRAPWDQAEHIGVPGIRPLEPGDRLGDRLADYAAVTLDARLMGLVTDADAERRERALEHARSLKEAVAEAEHLVLSPLVMDTLTSMKAGEASQRYAALPYPLCAIEWTGGAREAGLSGDDGTRWILLLNAANDDPRGHCVGVLMGTDDGMDDGYGFTHAAPVHLLPRENTEIAPFEEFEHDLSDVDSGGFASLRSDAMPTFAIVDEHRFEAFIMNMLALMNIPRATRTVTPRRSEVWETRDRKRRRCGFQPALGFKEVRLVVDVDGREEALAEMPRAAAGVGAADGQGRGAGVAWHPVRGHWRNLGDKETYVVPHFRGDPKVGVLRKRTTVALRDEVLVPTP